MLSLARFSKMDLRPEPRSTYGIGHRCEKSVVGMRRCDQWQVIECSAWRRVQQGECKRIPLVPLVNVRPFPKPLQEETRKRCENTRPFTKRTATVIKQNRGTLLTGIRNEGKSGYMGFGWCNSIQRTVRFRRTLNLARKGFNRSNLEERYKAQVRGSTYVGRTERACKSGKSCPQC
jgi:hypothetical protein